MYVDLPKKYGKKCLYHVTDVNDIVQAFFYQKYKYVIKKIKREYIKINRTYYRLPASVIRFVYNSMPVESTYIIFRLPTKFYYLLKLEASTVIAISCVILKGLEALDVNYNFKRQQIFFKYFFFVCKTYSQIHIKLYSISM